MKRKTLFWLVLVLVSWFPSQKVCAQKLFEGTITWTVSLPQSGDGEKRTMNVNLKGHKTEGELDYGAMGTIKFYDDAESTKEYLVFGDSKSGKVVDHIQRDSAIQANEQTLKLTATGHRDTIAGHAAKEYTFMDAGNNVSIWVSGGFPKSLRDRADATGQEDAVIPAALAKLAKNGLFPVKLVIYQQGKVVSSMEFVKYKEQSLDDTLFVPPSDVTLRCPTISSEMTMH